MMARESTSKKSWRQSDPQVNLPCTPASRLSDPNFRYCLCGLCGGRSGIGGGGGGSGLGLGGRSGIGGGGGGSGLGLGGRSGIGGELRL
jgi:hypothetical protein